MPLWWAATMVTMSLVTLGGLTSSHCSGGGEVLAEIPTPVLPTYKKQFIDDIKGPLSPVAYKLE